ncbi:hypothetical protein ACS0TY_029114 [Phlomoides rotata]
MGSLLPAAYNLGTSINLPCKKTRFFKPLQVKAQSYRDRHEGKSRDIIDTNLGVLRMRIEEAKKKERLERCLVAEHGWNYTSNFKPKSNYYNKININEIIQLGSMVGATFGLTILSCSSCLCLASLLLHFNQ